MYKLKCVLLIEDDHITNFINSRLIKNLGITLDIAIQKSVEEGISYLESKVRSNDHCPELILLDINMPGKDGYDFVNEFKQIRFPAKPPEVVILTTSTHPNDMVKFNELNAAAYLTKPLTKEKLLAILEQLF